MVERQAHALEGEIAAFQPHLRATPHLGSGGNGIGVGNDGERKDAVGIGAPGEVGGPVVVARIDPDAEVGVVDQVVDHQAAVDDLLLEPVAVEIGDAQLRRGRPRLGAGIAVPEEAGLLHLVDMAERALGVGQEARADAVPHAAVLVVDEPVLPVIALLDPRRVLLPLGGRLRRPEIGRAIGEVDVVVAGNELVLHGAFRPRQDVSGHDTGEDIVRATQGARHGSFPLSGASNRSASAAGYRRAGRIRFPSTFPRSLFPILLLRKWSFKCRRSSPPREPSRTKLPS